MIINRERKMREINDKVNVIVPMALRSNMSSILVL